MRLELLGRPPAARARKVLKGIAAPRAEELTYYQAIRAIARQAQTAVRDTVLPALPGILSTSAAPRVDDLSDDLSALWDRLKGALRSTDDAARTAAVSMLQRVQVRHANAFDAAYGDVLPVINPLAGEPWLAQQMAVALQENAALIQSIPAQLAAEVQGIVSRGVLAGTRSPELAREIVARFAVSEQRAALIASDQTLKWHGSLQRNRQVDAGITEYTWSTSHDERVRPGHRALNGTVQTWGKPPIDDPRTGARHDPGMAVRCRCVAVPVMPD